MRTVSLGCLTSSPAAADSSTIFVIQSGEKEESVQSHGGDGSQSGLACWRSQKRITSLPDDHHSPIAATAIQCRWWIQTHRAKCRWSSFDPSIGSGGSFESEVCRLLNGEWRVTRRPCRRARSFRVTLSRLRICMDSGLKEKAESLWRNDARFKGTQVSQRGLNGDVLNWCPSSRKLCSCLCESQ